MRRGHFPTLHDTIKEKDAGYDHFCNNAHAILEDLQPFYTVLCQLLEFRGKALALLQQMSDPKTVLNFSPLLNELVFTGYYNLMLQYAKLHILVGILASPHGRGKLALATYAKAHAVMKQGRVPPEYEALAKYLMDYESPCVIRSRSLDLCFFFSSRPACLSPPACTEPEAAGSRRASAH